MKKLCLVIVITICSITSMNAQGNFNLGANVGIPTGDVSEVYSFVLGIEANYLIEVSDEFQIGPSVSFVNYFGESIFGIEIDDATFLPIGGAARYSASDKIMLGLDLGYAIGISDGLDGGFHYRPLFGYNISEKVMLQAFYSGISINRGTAGNFGVGAMFAL